MAAKLATSAPGEKEIALGQALAIGIRSKPPRPRLDQSIDSSGWVVATGTRLAAGVVMPPSRARRSSQPIARPKRSPSWARKGVGTRRSLSWPRDRLWSVQENEFFRHAQRPVWSKRSRTGCGVESLNPHPALNRRPQGDKMDSNDSDGEHEGLSPRPSQTPDASAMGRRSDR
jgi:hypothetical protein